MIKISNVTEETKEKIKRSSAYSLPHNPTGAGYKPQDIKNALFKPIVDGQNSVLAEIDNLITKINDVLNTQLAATISLGVYKNGTEGGISWRLATANGGILASGTIPIEQEVKNSYNLISAKAVDDKFTAYDNVIGNNIEASIDQDYKLTVALKSKSGILLSESAIDLPIESMIIGASYKDGVLTLQLKNNDDGSIGNTIDVNISDLIRGLVNNEDFAQLKQELSTKPQVHFVSENVLSFISTLLMEIHADKYDNRYRAGDFIFFESPEYADYVVVDVTGKYTGKNVIEIPTVNDIDLVVAGSTAGKTYKIGNKITIATIDVGVLSEYVEKIALSEELKHYVPSSLFNTSLEKKQDKTNYKSFNNGDKITVEDNTIYTTTDTINNLTISYPKGDFICSFIFTVGDITQGAINFPDSSKYIGKAPDFQEGETWEINIMNGAIASGKVVSKE